MKNLLIGVDIGTQTTKAIVVTPDGEILAIAQEEYTVDQPYPTWAEQSPQVWEEAFYSTVRKVIEKGKISSKHVAALALSGLYGGSGVPVDQNMIPLRPCIIWMDRRAISEVEWVKNHVDLERLFKVTGNYVDSYFGFTKILWIKRNEPHIWEKVYKFVPPNSYIAYLLTEKLAIDYSSAGNLGGLFDIKRLTWSEEMSKSLGIPLELMPERLVPSTEVVGELLPKAAARAGLVPGIPVVIGGIDAAVATLSAGAVEPGDNVAMMGTSTCWGIVHVGESLSPNLVSMPHVVNPGKEIYTWGGASTSGAIVRWFRDNFGQMEKAAAEKVGLDAYQVLDLSAEKIPPGSAGLLVLPYFMGERAPLWDPQARGVIMGLTLFHTKAHVYRALMEAAAYSLRYAIETGEKAGLKVKEEVRLVGGVTKSRLWPQLIADVLGRPVVVPMGHTEAPLADALLAGIGVGLIPDHRVICEWVKKTSIFYPRDEAYASYSRLYEIYRQAYESTCGLMHKLADFQRDI